MLPIIALRAAAMARHAAATRKISRLKTVKGAVISGTKDDPRVARKLIGKYTQKQLNAYIARLDKFVSRETQFQGLRDGKYTTKQAWQAYKQSEQFANDLRKQKLDKYGDNSIRGSTVRERVEYAQNRSGKSMGNPETNFSWKMVNRSPEQIQGPEQLDKLHKALLKRGSQEAVDKEIKAAWESIDKMFEMIRDDALYNKLKSLTKDQFEEMWLTPGLAREISLMYENLMRYESVGDDPYGERLGLRGMESDSSAMLHSMIDEILSR